MVFKTQEFEIKTNSAELFDRLSIKVEKPFDSFEVNGVFNIGFDGEIKTLPFKKDLTAKIWNSGDQSRCSNSSLLFMITSYYKNIRRRQNIRDTWGNQGLWDNYLKSRNMNTGLCFLIGISKSLFSNAIDFQVILKESKKFGDMILIDIDENFSNLTFELLYGFQWVTKNYKFNYLFKGDDDTLVNIHSLVSLLKDQATPSRELYIGNVMHKTEVLRTGRYGISKKEWPYDSYPSYCSGGGFIISKDLVEKIIPHYNWENPLKIGDVYIGELVLRVGVNPIHNKNFQMDELKCKYHTTTVAIHMPYHSTYNKNKCTSIINRRALHAGYKYLSFKV